MKLRIGIVGRGFVGGAINKFLKENSEHEIKSYDITDAVDTDAGYSKIVRHSDMIYLCVPTPMDKQGRCYIGIVGHALGLLNFWAKHHNKMPIVLLKSTMVPGTTNKLQDKHDHLILAANPEFLTEKNAYQDLQSSKLHIIGIPDAENNPLSTNLKEYHRLLWPDAEIILTEPTEAEFIKYTINSFLALKVTFFNHIHQICHAVGANYNVVADAVKKDSRIGETHLNVPGPDGKMGFGGSCFPKDTNGFANLFKDFGVNETLFSAAIAYNNFIRPEKDWEELKGRVIV